MTPQQKIDAILEKLRNGHTVYVTTRLRSTKITPRTLASWEKDGLTLFKADTKNIYMASGRNFVCIDGCQITYK